MPRTRPLYRLDGESMPDRRHPKGHAGLWFDKFCWEIGGRDGESDKRDWIATVAGAVGTDAQLEEYAQRVVRLIQAGGGDFAVFRAVSRFVTGLGRSHPVENGFAWHPTLGTPYLPGSSVKGMVRAWAQTVGGADGAGDTINRLLGDRERSGIISFIDAVPTSSTALETDVMTPHYGNWTVDDPPGDWRSPIPIPFLTVASGATMLAGVVPGSAASEHDVATVMDWIGQAFEYQGAGAKTAVGYGRFERDEGATAALIERVKEIKRKAAEERRRAGLSPLRREIEEVIDGARGQSKIVAVYQAAKDGRWEGAQKLVVAEWLKAEMERDKTWLPTPKKKKQRKAHARTRAVMSWLGDA